MNGRRGWGALLRCNGQEKELCGGERNTTNNRMELTAVIAGLDAPRSRACLSGADDPGSRTLSASTRRG